MTYLVSAPTLAAMLATAFVGGLALGLLRGRSWMLERIKRELANRRATLGSVWDARSPSPSPSAQAERVAVGATVHRLYPEPDE